MCHEDNGSIHCQSGLSDTYYRPTHALDIILFGLIYGLGGVLCVIKRDRKEGREEEGEGDLF